MRVTTESSDPNGVPLDKPGSLRRAWIYYGLMFFTPVVLLALFGWARLMDMTSRLDPYHARTGFVATLFWIGITGPLGFWLQERAFASYYKGVPVSARDYLRGKLVVWTCLVSGAVVACVLVFLSQSLFPHVFAICVVYAFMCTQYPNGRAMTHPHGDKDRAQLYADPK